MSGGIEYAIETSGLTRRFGDFVAVDGVSLRIPKGHLYGFLGLTGVGQNYDDTDADNAAAAERRYGTAVGS